MAAKDYHICTGIFDAYITKISRRHPNQMTDDRRSITEDEVLELIDWYLNEQLGDKYKSFSYNSGIRKGKRVQIKYIDNQE